MDVVFNPPFLRFEVWFFLANASVVIGFLCWRLGHMGAFVWSLLNSRRTIAKRLQNAEGVSVVETEAGEIAVVSHGENAQTAEDTGATTPQTELPSVPTPTERERIAEIIARSKLKIARAEYGEARTLIIEGLSLDRFHRELNLLLASLYEIHKDYKKAELIYKDLVVTRDTDTELYLRLAFVLAVQGKHEIAYEVYRKLISLDEGNMEATEMLANLAHKLDKHEETLEYAKRYLKRYPNHLDTLWLVVSSHLSLGNKPQAVEILKKVQTLDPYNADIGTLMEKLNLEIDMARNFGDTSPSA